MNRIIIRHARFGKTAAATRIRIPRSLSTGPARSCLLLLFIAACSLGPALADWRPRPIQVHEWGVSEFDWSGRPAPAPAFPDFFYTDQNPGETRPSAKPRENDVPFNPARRVRSKPILYFYGPDNLRGTSSRRPVSVSVQVRFHHGHAFAWWPQVTRFRTPEEAAQAPAPDLDAWDRMRMQTFREHLEATLAPGQVEQIWSRFGHRKFIPDYQGDLRAFGGLPPFPEDERFQLVWNQLELQRNQGRSGPVSPGRSPRAALEKESNWVAIARQVDSDFVSNGKESEKFLAYEGKTGEPPAVALVPDDWFSPRDPGFWVYNVSDHPIHDVFLIYRNQAEGRYWTRYFPELQPMRDQESVPSGQQSSPHPVQPAIPNFQLLPKEEFIGETEFLRRTQVQLARTLIKDLPEPGQVYTGGRNPAQYQPPTRDHRLFPKEVVVLQRIWNQAFFENDGLTILYRESPDYVDEAVPLQIFTGPDHYINLSRCSLVSNRNIHLSRILDTARRLNSALGKIQPAAGRIEPPLKQIILDCLEEEPFGTLAFLDYYRQSGRHSHLLTPLLAELRER